MVEVSSYTSLAVVTIILHWKPLHHIRQGKGTSDLERQTHMLLRQVLLPRPQIPCFMCIVRHRFSIPWYHELPNLELGVGDRTARNTSIRRPVEPSVHDIFAPKSTPTHVSQIKPLENFQVKHTYHRSLSSPSMSWTRPSWVMMRYGAGLAAFGFVTTYPRKMTGSGWDAAIIRASSVAWSSRSSGVSSV